MPGAREQQRSAEEFRLRQHATPHPLLVTQQQAAPTQHGHALDPARGQGHAACSVSSPVPMPGSSQESLNPKSEMAPPPPALSPEERQRVILHFDVDCFYCQV